MDKAIDFLREKGLAAAAKKAGRIAAEGLVVSYVSEDAKVGVIVEVNCETDFVAKTENFQELVAGIAAHVAKSNPADMDALNASEIEEGKTVAALITESIAKIGENISLRRFARYEAAEGMVAAYIHGGGKIGVLVSMTAGTEELGHDVAMHIAAANPGYLNREQVPTAELEHEKAVLTEQARNEGKPENIIEKMVIGRIQKYYKEVCLVDQEFVKDPDQTVGKLVAAAGAAVTEFTRFQLGEGIEKKQEDFAAEVMAQIK
jgi:elongation factor Ts